MSKIFKPFLAPNEEIDLSSIKYPLLVSTKLDGLRLIFYKGLILTRSLKELPNKQLKAKFEPLRKFSEDNQIVLDGEIYSHELTFQEIISFSMTDDLTDPKTVKKNGGILEIPEHLKFYCFDMIGNVGEYEDFSLRHENMEKLISLFPDIALTVGQKRVESKEQVLSFFEEVLACGYEGLILKDPNGRYKYGRGTVKEGLIYKVKPFETFDAQIIDVVQSTEVNDGVKRIINELGRSVTSKKKDDRHFIEKASAFMVEYEGKPLKVTLAMPDSEKIEIWGNRASYIGRTIEYKGMLVGAKDVPRHPVMVRFRTDKDK